ncbi:hypothetical protein PUN4_330134 [Paraburkholderia unamae]|nr:hypothetical protein PUN4_330134 [Paraburkholderia unamae]
MAKAYTPPSSSGLRSASVWNTNASMSMPTAVIAQPISTAPASALTAMFCGREKMPPPTIDPTTRAVSAPSRSLVAVAGAAALSGAAAGRGDAESDMGDLHYELASAQLSCDAPTRELAAYRQRGYRMRKKCLRCYSNNLLGGAQSDNKTLVR